MTLATACATNDEEQLLAILGPLCWELISSGDEVADKSALERFAAAFEQAHELVPTEEGRETLQVGEESWSLPVTISRHGDSWHFDPIVIKKEMILRRIDSNEHSAIKICRLYVETQNEYAHTPHGWGHVPGVYAQKLRSDSGTHNGLYWEDDASGEENPARALFDLAHQEGYGPDGSRPQSYNGYYFQILTAQGKNAPGGEKSYVTGERGYLVGGKSYIVFDRMTDGFALVAYPAKYRFSGVKTFIVNHDGIVYQKNLGGQTSADARVQSQSPRCRIAPTPTPSSIRIAPLDSGLQRDQGKNRRRECEKSLLTATRQRTSFNWTHNTSRFCSIIAIKSTGLKLA